MNALANTIRTSSVVQAPDWNCPLMQKPTADEKKAVPPRRARRQQR
jgi:hypothetical protein